MKLTDVFMGILAINSIRNFSLVSGIVVVCCAVYATARLVERRTRK